MDLASLRKEYSSEVLDIDSTQPDPLKQFEHWFEQAIQAELLEPNAMTLATVDAESRPAARTVLLKMFDERGMVFYTNYNSRKSQHITANPNVTLLFQWLPLQRQVEINGTAARVSTAESMKYFMVRPRGSQLGAWISQQSSVISNRKILESKLQELKAKFAGGEIPLPDFWGGYRVTPHRMEFWQGGEYRLHDRIEYRLEENGAWQRRRLSP
ncbi:pyridoxamine 5'-phosphate oxidase [Novipirellula artificiosorum]|uniref:Pyridoxine/pyridoxamine 5'-phosphate oxidase n=1 Tax=Novipirellula artificiosorum TaxID=2528016 RepID=A0A5C6DZ60_9BACT|nr:pyridoxamine 5'-phosphate oxidase [Novipirellula artificiosorum]TWU40711.1 Pyridoxine/pyridoxamine 5'-phosphate oxidase [Novipirellula artificiosorum]